jgi:four helix bundle protein
MAERESGGDTHRDLIVWQKAMQLAVHSYRIARRLPHYEQRELGMELRTAAGSIPRNIAEGKGRKGRRTNAEFVQFLSIARGSTRELDTSLELTVQLEFVDRELVAPVLSLAEEVSRWLTAIMNRLKPL